jgi:hypothetical protein
MNVIIVFAIIAMTRSVFSQRVLQPFHAIDERINDITVWSSMQEKKMAMTAVGALNQNRTTPTVSFLTFCDGKVYNDGIFSFPQLKNGSQFRAISSIDGFVLLGTTKSQVIAAGRLKGDEISLSETFPITALTSFTNDENEISFLVATWDIPSKLVRFDVNSEDRIEQGPSINLPIGRIRAGVSSGTKYSYFVSDMVPSMLVTIDNNLFQTVSTITLPCDSVRSGFIRSGLGDYEYSFWTTHSSSISICKVKHNKRTGFASVDYFLQINRTDDLAATSVCANERGQIVVGTKSYHDVKPATIFLLKDESEGISLERRWTKFDDESSTGTINCIRFDDDIAYLVNRKNPGEIMSINVTEESSREEIPFDFSERNATHCPILVYGGGKSQILPSGAPLVFEIKNPARNEPSEIQWIQIALKIQSDEMSALEIFFEIDLGEEKEEDHFFPVYLGGSSLENKISFLDAKFSSASLIGLANFIASRVDVRDIKSFKLVVRNREKFMVASDEYFSIEHFNVQLCSAEG